MRWLATTILVLLPAVACARSSLRGSFRGGGRVGRHGRGGLTVLYGRRGSDSRLGIRFHSGATCYRGVRGYGIGGPYRGFSSYGVGGSGVVVYRGWYPHSPLLYRGHPGAVYRRVGPFQRTDAVIFTGTPGVQVFGYRARPMERPAAAPPKPSPIDDAGLSADQLVDIADTLFAQGRFERAAEAYRAAAHKKPDDPMTAFALGHGLFAVGAYAEAAGALRRGLRLYPDFVGVRMDRRHFYGDPAAFEAQLQRLEAFVAAHPDDRPARFLLAYNYFFSGQRQAAREHFQALGPGDSEAQMFLRHMARGK
ncbi:MAG: tetratricopeptide repeat protein [Candidatus Brocadiia bacterium]